MMHLRIFVGFDQRELAAFDVARFSIARRLSSRAWVSGLSLAPLRRAGIYRRPHNIVDGKLFDIISQAFMSTEFACSRFLVPHLCEYEGWALFTDADVLAQVDVLSVFDHVTEDKAVWCVKHNHVPTQSTKMDGQKQYAYNRKNWSSVILFKCDHPSNRKLTAELVNTVPGRDLHAFCWLEDDEIGELPADWNYLVGHTQNVTEPKIVHFTDGYPLMHGYEDCEYADAWRREFDLMIERGHV